MRAAAASLCTAVLVGCGSHAAPSPPAQQPSASAAPSPVASPGPRLPGTAADAAAQVAAAEAVIADPDAQNGDLEASARRQQLAYRAIARHPGWDDTVLAAVPKSLRRLVTDNVAARRAFAAINHTVATTVPAWSISDPPAKRQLLDDFHAAGRRYGVGWSYLAAIMITESASGRIHGLSTAGAQGPMQFLPSTWATYGDGGDINDPDDAIPAAARFLVAHGAREPGGMTDALYAYNNSADYVRGVTLLAQIMARQPREYLGYYHWEVYYVTSAGDVHLRVGYRETHPVPVDRYLAAHPGALLSGSAPGRSLDARR